MKRSIFFPAENNSIASFIKTKTKIVISKATNPYIATSVTALVGEHTAVILGWLGYGPDEIRRLADQGAVQLGGGS